MVAFGDFSPTLRFIRLQKLLFLNVWERVSLRADGLLCWGAVLQLVTQIRALRAGAGGVTLKRQQNWEVGGVGIITAKSKFFGLEVLETMEPLVFLLPLRVRSYLGR